MVKDMEMYLKEIIKKTNPQEYIKILEEDRQDFAEEINRLQEKIDKAIEYLEEQKNTNQTIVDKTGWYIRDKVYNILKGDNK